MRMEVSEDGHGYFDWFARRRKRPAAGVAAVLPRVAWAVRRNSRSDPPQAGRGFQRVVSAGIAAGYFHRSEAFGIWPRRPQGNADSMGHFFRDNRGEVALPPNSLRRSHSTGH